MSRFASELRLENFVKLFTKRIEDQDKLIDEIAFKISDLKKPFLFTEGLAYSEVEVIKHKLSSLKIEQEKEQKVLRKLKTKLYFYERELNNLRTNEKGS